MGKNGGDKAKGKTPMLDELKGGPWPSFMDDLENLAKRKPVVEQLLGQLEQSYQDRWNYWQGTVLNVPGYGGGVIARLSDLTDKYPKLNQFHTIRVIAPSGFVYSTKALRNLCDITEKHGAGIVQLHGMTGDILLLGYNDEQTYETAEDLMDAGWDIGGSGPALRTLACCIGPARCEMSCYDTLSLTKHITDKYISELHRPEFAYKFKFKLSGCANDCANSMQRSDMPIIGTWRGPMQIDQEEVGKFIDEHSEKLVYEQVLSMCPTKCITLEDRKIVVESDDCVHCMHCINVMHKALAVGKDKGVTILLGGKRTLKIGDTMSAVLVPFMKVESEKDWGKITDLVDTIWEFWNDNANEHERIGEFVARIGLATFLKGVGIEPDPNMINRPRISPYIRFEEYGAAPRLGGEQKKEVRVLNKDKETMESVS
ncbi:MAG: sulfite reductase, dissimilatory-type subunit alpha [bacterium]|nr:MAG: sulfite reductase, dissimilatory-type subunit alpha [bacterium]